MNPFRLRTLAGALAASLIVISPYAAAEDGVSQIKQQLDELDQKIRVLQRLQELDKEAATVGAGTELTHGDDFRCPIAND